MTPFESFFAHDFQSMLSVVPDEKLFSDGIRGLAEASWDRKAAFLVWDALGRPDASAGRTFPGSTAKAPQAAKGAPAVDLFADLTADPADQFDSFHMSGTTCSECGLYQRESPGGTVCRNGHGGAPGEEPETHFWYHPESNSLFKTAPGEAFPTDGLVEHIDKDTYDQFAKNIAEEDAFNIL